MNEVWLRIGILILGLVIILLYYWFVVRSKNHHTDQPLKDPGLFSRKPKVPDFSEVESDDVKITRRIPAEEADKIRAQTKLSNTGKKPLSADEQITETQQSESSSQATSGEDVSTANQSGAVSESHLPTSESASGTEEQHDMTDKNEQVDNSVANTPEQSQQADLAEESKDSNSANAADPSSETADSTNDQHHAIAPEAGVAGVTEVASSVAELLVESDSEKPDESLDHEGSVAQQPSGEVDNAIAEWMTDGEPSSEAAERAEIAPEAMAQALEETVTYPEAQPKPEAVTIKDREYSRRRGRGLLGLLGLRRDKPQKSDSQSAATSENNTSTSDSGATEGKLSYTPAASNDAPTEPKSPRKMVVIALYPQTEGKLFSGREIKNAMNTFSLVLSSKTGYYESLNALSAPGEVETVFSVGHLRGDSRFSRTTINTMETTGLVFFMNIPGPVNAADSVDMMFSIAAKSAKMLDAKVCDQHKRKLTVDQMMNIRDEAVSFQQALMDSKLL